MALEFAPAVVRHTPCGFARALQDLGGCSASQQALHGQDKRELEKLLLVLKDECINFFGHTP